MASRVVLRLSALLATALFLSVQAAPLDEVHDHAHEFDAALPAIWHHEPDHPAHALFRRQDNNPTDGATYPKVGSSTWSAAYPVRTPDVSKLPQAWVTALNNAVAAGKIPNIPQSTMIPGASPAYPPSVKPNTPEVCAATARLCRNPDDTWDAPKGVVGLGFDDGPLPTSQGLYTFLQSHNQRATHFFIGVNILQNPDMFMTAYSTLKDDIAVHTYTHPYMTTLSNLDVLGQLGWTMQIIHDSTGGRLPRYWRPPYGDVDNRVRAIAKEIFGLSTIMWNQDTADWSLTTGGTTPAAIHNNMQKWLSGPKSPGLVILEHEVSTGAVNAFIDAYPLMTSNGWTAASVAQLAAAGGATWGNSDGYNAPVTSKGIIDDGTFGAARPTALVNTSTPTGSGGGSATSAASNQSPTQPSGKSNSATAAFGASSAMSICWTFAAIWFVIVALR